MFQELGLAGWTPSAAAVALGLLLGLAFGALAERSRFCLRRGLVGRSDEQGPALGVWALALATAIAGTTLLMATGLVSLAGHRYLAPDLPALAIVVGGLMFGAGMVLARGCTSRLSVLAGTGNLRAAVVLLVFALTAHATLKGVLAPVRVTLGGWAIHLGSATSLGAFPGGAPVWATLASLALIVVAVGSGARPLDLVRGAAIGLLVPFAWAGTGVLLQDEFAPIAVESLAFTSAASETLFWLAASSAVGPTFGVGVLGGVLAGSALSALAAGRFAVAGFTADTPTASYLAGGALMGIGGVLAGGCTVGAGLSGVSTLSLAGILALVSIVAGSALPRLLTRTAAARRPVLLAAE